MIRFFRTTEPAKLILVPFIVLLFRVNSFFSAGPVNDNEALPAGDILTLLFGSLPGWVNWFLLVALVSGQAIYFNAILNRHSVLYRNSNLPALVYALLISASPAFDTLHPALVINLLLLFILDKLFSLFKDERLIARLFDCGFLTGVSFLIYFPSLVLLPFIFTALSFIRPFRLKEWLIVLTGFLVPVFLASAYFYWNRMLPGFWQHYGNEFASAGFSPVIASSTTGIIVFSYITGMVLFALFRLAVNFRKNVVRTRTLQRIFLILILFGFGWLFLCGEFNTRHLALFVIPAAVFCSYLFLLAKKRMWMYETVLWMLVVLIAWNHLA